METNSEKGALKRALRFISYRMRTENEVRSRLKRYGYPARIIEDVVSRLRNSGLIDDFKFAQIYAEELIRKGYGLKRIKLAMRKIGLGRKLIEDTLERIYPTDDEEARANEVANRILNRVKNDRDARRKIYSYLIRRGFDDDIARKVADRLVDIDISGE